MSILPVHVGGRLVLFLLPPLRRLFWGGGLCRQAWDVGHGGGGVGQLGTLEPVLLLELLQLLLFGCPWRSRPSLLMMLLILRLLMLLLLVSPGTIVVAERASPPILLAFLLMLLVPVKIVNAMEKRIFIWEVLRESLSLLMICQLYLAGILRGTKAGTWASGEFDLFSSWGSG